MKCCAAGPGPVSGSASERVPCLHGTTTCCGAHGMAAGGGKKKPGKNSRAFQSKSEGRLLTAEQIVEADFDDMHICVSLRICGKEAA